MIGYDGLHLTLVSRLGANRKCKWHICRSYELLPNLLWNNFFSAILSYLPRFRDHAWNRTGKALMAWCDMGVSSEMEYGHRLSCCEHRLIQPCHRATFYNLQVKLHQLKSHLHLHKHKPLMDRLHVVEQKTYNKRCTCYFMRFILTFMRIIYNLSRAHYYCSGSPRRMTSTHQERITKKSHAWDSTAWQNHQKESATIFYCQKLWRPM
jgi:hypothetical protein